MKLEHILNCVQSVGQKAAACYTTGLYTKLFSCPRRRIFSNIL